MGLLDVPQEDIHVLLVDDQVEVLESLSLLLEDEPGVSVVGSARNGEEALFLAENLLPHVVVMDVKMPRMDGLETTRRLKTLYPQMRVILLSMYDSEEYIKAGQEAGASKYFLKGTSTQQLIDAIKEKR